MRPSASTAASASSTWSRRAGWPRVLLPGRDPGDRPAERAGQRRHRHVLAVGGALRAEAAAQVRHDHAHPCCGRSQRGGQVVAKLMRRLARCPRPSTRPGPAPSARSGRAAQRRGADPMVDDAHPQTLRGPAKAASTSPPHGHEPVTDVVAVLRMEQGRVQAQRRLGRGDGRQRLVLDLHQLRGVLGLALGSARRPRRSGSPTKRTTSPLSAR